MHIYFSHYLLADVFILSDKVSKQLRRHEQRAKVKNVSVFLQHLAQRLNMCESYSGVLTGIMC